MGHKFLTRLITESPKWTDISYSSKYRQCQSCHLCCRRATVYRKKPLPISFLPQSRALLEGCQQDNNSIILHNVFAEICFVWHSIGLELGFDYRYCCRGLKRWENIAKSDMSVGLISTSLNSQTSSSKCSKRQYPGPWKPESRHLYPVHLNNIGCHAS